jgi:hypothetical protein
MCYTMNDITLKHTLQIFFLFYNSSIIQKKEKEHSSVSQIIEADSRRSLMYYDLSSSSWKSTYVTLFCTSFVPLSSIVIERERERENV